MIDVRYWQAALDVQSACNLSGVVLSFAEAMQAINEEAHRLGKGTDWKNTHPICVLFSTQIGHLTKTSALAEESVYSAAYQAAFRLVEIDTVIDSLRGMCDQCGQDPCQCDQGWGPASQIDSLEKERDSILEKINAA